MDATNRSVQKIETAQRIINDYPSEIPLSAPGDHHKALDQAIRSDQARQNVHTTVDLYLRERPSTNATNRRVQKIETAAQRIINDYPSEIPLSPSEIAHKALDQVMRSYLDRVQPIEARKVINLAKWSELRQRMKLETAMNKAQIVGELIGKLKGSSEALTEKTFDETTGAICRGKPFERFSNHAQGLLKQYAEGRRAISEFEPAWFRNAPLKVKEAVLTLHQKRFGRRFTEKHVAALESYTTGQYKDINAFCRANAPWMKEEIKQNGKSFDEIYDQNLNQVEDTRDRVYSLVSNDLPFQRTREHISLLDQTFRGNRLPEKTVVRKDIKLKRILPFLQDEHGRPQETLQAGYFLADKAFVSTSLNPNNVYSTAYQGDTAVAQIYIKLPKGGPGMYIAPYSATRGEHEILLPRNTHIRFDKVIRLDKSGLSNEERGELHLLPSYLIEASLVER